MVNVPITICTAQLQARSALCFISLIKSLNLNLNLADCLNILQLIIDAQTCIPSPQEHACLQRALRCWLGLVLLVTQW